MEAVAAANPLEVWHLLSLDAPSVAALWTWFVAHAHRVQLPAKPVAAMFLAVWVLYAADRLLDARSLRRALVPSRPGVPVILEARHLFHHRYRTRFVACACMALVVLAALVPELNHVAVRLFAAEGFVLAGWFVTLHATPFARHLPKELALGVFFSAAVFIPTAARMHGSTLPLLVGAALFALLCSLNCLFIYRWEAPPYAEAGHPTTRFAARFVIPLGVAVVGIGTALGMASSTFLPPVSLAVALAAAALLLLDRLRPRLPPTMLRAAADFALLTPLVVLLVRR
jgi:hypothetical protein